jgi:hypothetical protein
MDYMSENSNISVTALLPVGEEALAPKESEEFNFMRPKRMPQQPRKAPSSCFSSSSGSFGYATLEKPSAFSPVSLKRNSSLPRTSNASSSSALSDTPRVSSDLDTKPVLAPESIDHRPLYLPKFREPRECMWTASHAANCPSEDRSASLVNLLLQPLPPNFDSETQLPPLEPDYKTLIRLNLWAVIDGHGGGCVATYASEVLLPHIAASVSRALGCAIVDRGVCTVNGQLRDANALDLDSLIKTSFDNRHGNPNSIQYRSPYERSDSEEEEEEGDEDGGGGGTLSETDDNPVTLPKTAGERKQIASLKDAVAGGASLADSLLRKRQSDIASGNEADASVSSVKTSVKTAASPANREDLLGTHSPREVAAITRAITESFLAVDEGWINSVSNSVRGNCLNYLNISYSLKTCRIYCRLTLWLLTKHRVKATGAGILERVR